MAITAAGIGTNIDVNGLVSQLMAIERRPLDALNQKKREYNSELSAYGKLKSDLAAVQSAIGSLQYSSSFQVYTATPADTTLFSATADSTAIAGTHSVTVGQLAKSQKLVSTAFADTGTTQLGTGTLAISNGTSSFNVTIDATNNTLSGIANAINSATGNFGVSATILNDGTGYRLVVSPNDTGASKAITIGVTDTGDGNNLDNFGLSRLSYTAGGYNLTQTQAAQDATLTVDGLAGITSASNTVTGVIQGVTLSLKNAGTTTVQVAVDNATLTNNATSFVTAYNNLIKDVNSLHQKGGTLEGDNTVLTMQSQLTSVFNTAINLPGNTYSAISQVGISFQKDGTLSLDTTTFQAALSGHLNDVKNLFTDSTQGFAQQLNSQLNSLLQTNGVLDAATTGINNNISDITMRADQMQTRLDAVQLRLQNQFAALDGLIGSMKQTSSALLAQLGH